MAIRNTKEGEAMKHNEDSRKSIVQGGVTAQRGFIFQSIIAMIECLERHDWDEIKNEPKSDEDKVDIALYRDKQIISAIQVKSSINPFDRTHVEKWLEALKNDAKASEEVYLYLVGDSFISSCEDFIRENPKEIRKISFENIHNICIGKLVEYIKRSGFGGDIRVDDLEVIDDSLFAQILKNSTAIKPISRTAFEERFRRTLPIHVIPLCLTPIPAIDYEVGLVGRDEITHTVCAMLEENSCTVLVSGLGGIGKTAIMRYVCSDVKNHGKYVAWIKCSDNLRDDLLILRNSLGVPRGDCADDAYKKVIDKIKSQLGGKLYIFLDDLSKEFSRDEQNTLISLGAHIMITSRVKHRHFPSVSIDVLDDQAVINMFYRYYGGDKDHRYKETVRKIIHYVHSHTLLVELLAKAAKEEGGNLDNFYKKLKDEGFFDVSEEEFTTEHDDEELSIEESIIKLYKISNISKEQQRIMKLFTIFTPEKEIYYKIKEWADFDSKEMKKLVALGWLERGGLEYGYFIHQIVKDSLMRQMNQEGTEIRLEDYGALLDKVIDKEEYLDGTVTYEFVRERIVLAEDIATHLWNRWVAHQCIYQGEGKKWISNAGDLFTNLTMVYYAQGSYENALKYGWKAVVIREQLLGTDNLETATSYNGLGMVYQAQGNNEKAYYYYSKSLAICEMKLGMNKTLTAMTYNNIAMVYYAQGDYKNALDYYKKALVIHEQESGTMHPDTATVYNNIAGVYRKLGKYDKAREYQDKSLVIHELFLGTDHPTTAMTYNNMAASYTEKGDYDNALEYYNKALIVIEHMLGTEHPNTSQVYNNIAWIYHALGKYEEALCLYRKALDIDEHVLGIDHPVTVGIFANLVEVYEDLGDYDNALDNYIKILAVRVRALGLNHPDTAMIYSCIARVYCLKGYYGKAKEYYLKGLSIIEDTFGPDHLQTVAYYDGIARTLSLQGEYENALKWYKKVKTISETELGSEHLKTAKIYNNIAGIYQLQANYESALYWFLKSLSIMERVLSSEHPDTAATCNNIGVVYYLQGKFEKALEHYGKTVTVYERVFGLEHPKTGMIYQNIGGAFYMMGDYGKALEYYGKNMSIVEHKFGKEHPDLVNVYSSMATVYLAQKDFDKAMAYNRKALYIGESVLGLEHPDTAWIYNNVGMVLEAKGDYERALEYFSKALDIRERVLGIEHPDTAASYNNVAGVYRVQGEFKKALEYYQKDIAISEQVLGAEHYSTAMTYHNMAGLFIQMDEYAKALDYLKRAYSVFLSTFGENHPYTHETKQSIALIEQRS